MGRPTSYTPEVGEKIAERLSKGEPLARICDDAAMPAYSTARKWEKDSEEFSALSAQARANGTHFIADDCLRIADDPEIDPQHKRIMVDTRLRLIGKWNAKAYGDKLDLNNNHGLQDGLASLLKEIDGRTRDLPGR